MLVQDEILIVGLINEKNVQGKIFLSQIRYICFDLLQVGNMYTTLLQHLRDKKLVKPGVDLN